MPYLSLKLGGGVGMKEEYPEEDCGVGHGVAEGERGSDQGVDQQVYHLKGLHCPREQGHKVRHSVLPQQPTAQLVHHSDLMPNIHTNIYTQIMQKYIYIYIY
jgi:hypothetical protein